MKKIARLKKVFANFVSWSVMPEVLNPASSDFSKVKNWIPAQHTAGMTDNINLKKNQWRKPC
jgi:hypothetical protein